MVITRETDYALRTLLCLAKLDSDEYVVVPTTVLSERMAIPYRFLRKIVSKLVNAGLLESRRGKTGGLTLAKSPADISLIDVILAVDAEGIVVNRCLKSATGCERAPLCGGYKVFRDMQEQMVQTLRDVSLATIAEQDECSH